MTEKTHESPVSMTPGKLLSAAREARGFSLAEIAKQTRLSVQTICDIEQDDYKHIGARPFVRGYLCTYARLVNVPEKQILEALEASGLMPAETYPTLPIVESVPVTNVTHLRSRSLNARWILSGVSALILIALIIWWQDAPLSSKEIPIKHAQTNTDTSAMATISQPDATPSKQVDTQSESVDANSQPITALSASKTVPTVKKVVGHKEKTKMLVKKDKAVSISKKNNDDDMITGFVTKPSAALHPTYTISPAP